MFFALSPRARAAIRCSLLLCLVPGCENYRVPKDTSGTLAACCDGLGRCVPSGLVAPQQTQSLSQDSCGESLLCAPRALVLQGSRRPPACTVSATGVEGRCLPGCLPEVARRKRYLEREVCQEGELCAPCFDPVSGEATGACDLGADRGPQEPARVFAYCCGDLGRCVPVAFVPQTDRKRLSRDSCAGEDELCAPEGLLRADDYVAVSCNTRATHAEGRCLPACLPELATRAGVLAQDGCAAGELCGACFDPADGRNTGACNLGGDPGPATAPVLFAACCGQLGRCVPGELIPERDRAQLTREACSAELDLCVPEPLLLDEDHVFERCTTFSTGVEGRCLAGCLPGVRARADELRQQSCADGHLCTPCFDPFDGTSTGACQLGGDPGPSESPMPFGDCCGELGRCVPQPLLSRKERAQLGRDSCGSDRDLCAPESLARDPGHVFSSCQQHTTGAEGRCLPACLPRVAARAAQLAQDGCAAAELCTPCFDPVDGSGTGACELGGDRGATQPPVLFASCAGGAGTCVPSALVSAEDRPQLARASCVSADALCVPTELARDTRYAFTSCSVSATGAEGRCLPEFLPDVSAHAAQLNADGCASGQLCAPCNDPLSGEATGACALGGDPGPAREPTTYPHCCSDAGRCIVSSQVPEAWRDKLAADGCDASSQLCVPLSLAQAPDAPPPTCHDAATGAEGRCLMQCLPQVAPQASRLRQSGCNGGELCVPCYDPVSGDSTGACNFSAADPGPSEPKQVFETCCGSDGLCVPEQLLPGGSSNLFSQSCTRTGYVCAPRVLAAEANGRLPSCGSLLGPSVCVASCFVPAGVGDVLPASSCSAELKCVPCWAASGLCP